jgi:hypothetical protein
MLHSVRRDNSPMAISLRIRQKELASVVTTVRTVAAWSNQGGHRRFKGNGGGFCYPSLAMAQNRLLATRIIGFAVSILGCVAPAPVAVLAAFGGPGRLGWLDCILMLAIAL